MYVLTVCGNCFHSLFSLKGAVVQGRVGSRWYMGRVHSLNLDQTLDVAFDDNDFRPAMPSDRVQVLISHVDKTRYVCTCSWTRRKQMMVVVVAVVVVTTFTTAFTTASMTASTTTFTTASTTSTSTITTCFTDQHQKKRLVC